MTDEEFDDLKAEVKYLNKKAGQVRSEANEAKAKLEKEKKERLIKFNINSEATRIRKEKEEAKKRRDEEIRNMLLPLAGQLVARGWRIRVTSWVDNKGRYPLFQLHNQKSNESVNIHWATLSGQAGFEWD